MKTVSDAGIIHRYLGKTSLQNKISKSRGTVDPAMQSDLNSMTCGTADVSGMEKP
jgi:hypothetical protein